MFDDLCVSLSNPLESLLGEKANSNLMSFLSEPKDVTDDTTKVLVRDSSKRKKLVIILSSEVNATLIARCVNNVNQTKQLLGQKLGNHIIDILFSGSLKGLSYMILPYCEPLSNKKYIFGIQKRLLKDVLLSWLLRATKKSARIVTSEEKENNYIVSLKYLADNATMPDDVRSIAEQGIENLISGKWIPKHTFMHNDFWLGNILMKKGKNKNNCPRTWKKRFVIIDWAGSQIDGFPIYDLIRLARSLSIKKGYLYKEIEKYRQSLECDYFDIKSYLLAALGNIGLKLEGFPYHRYIAAVNDCIDYINELHSCKISK